MIYIWGKKTGSKEYALLFVAKNVDEFNAFVVGWTNGKDGYSWSTNENNEQPIVKEL